MKTTPRQQRVPAGEAPRGGWYRTKAGTRVKLLARAHNSMGSSPAQGWVPYYAPANLRAQSVVDRYPHKGWAPPDYPLLPIIKKQA